MKRIKIGQIGVCHEHAAAKMKTLRRMDDVFEIVGVVDDRASRAVRFAGADLKAYEGLPWLTEAELFRTPGLQAVAIETANDDLVPAALRCLEHGLAMHMDKPGGYDLGLYDQLLLGCETRGIPFQIGYMFRANPAFQFGLQAVRRHWLGDLFEVQAGMSHHYGGDRYADYIGRLPGGILFNLGCHLVDFIVALLGRPVGVTPFLKSTPGVPDGVLNNGLAILEYPRATATIRACSQEVDGLARRRLTICGTQGTLELSPLERFDGEPLRLRLTLGEGNETYAAGTHAIDTGTRLDRYRDQLLELAQMIAGERDRAFDRRHELLVQEVLLAASGCLPWKA